MTGLPLGAHDPLDELAAIEERGHGRQALDEQVEWASAREAFAADLRWHDRLRATIGLPVAVKVRGVSQVQHATLDRVLSDGLVLRAGSTESLVPLAGVIWASGIAAAAAAAQGEVVARLGCSSILVGWAAQRSAVRVNLSDGSQLAGTVAAVGRDHVDLETRQATITLPSHAWTIMASHIQSP